ncbi:MAG: type I glyceraldehyde-3-phosphate dehydrogenase, partial [Chloroflexi bacterium]|nr:type I glyceraldehyde-3-phosphate dehydrogenase [Chloroflexota bacterium]
RFNIRKGLMSTIHSYTNDQKILDQVHDDLRRSRAAAANIVPTSTGAARAVGLALPELNGRIHGLAYRVPTTTVSIVDFTAEIDGDVTAEEINDAYREAAATSMQGILDVSDEPLVSSDFRGDPHSAILDSLSTIVIGGNMVKVLAWYDNEWGYSCRVSDLAQFMASKGL